MGKITISTGHPDAGRVYAEAYDAALAREAALREELNQYDPASPGTASKRARWLLNIQDACKYGLPKHLVQRLNNTTKEIQNSIKYGGTKRLRDENESLQQRLTVAEQRAVVLTEALEGMVEYFPEGNSDGECFSVERANLALCRPNDCIHDWFPDHCLKCGVTKP